MMLPIGELVDIEISKSERLRSVILIGLLGLEALLLLVVYFFYKEEYLFAFNSTISIHAIFVFTAIIISYETFIHYFLSKQDFYLSNARSLGFINSFSEITLLSGLFVFIVEYSGQTIILQAPATLTYFIFIVLSTLRLDFILSIFTGVLAAVEFILISVYYANYYTSVEPVHSNLSGMQYLGQGIIMIIAGVAAGFVSNFIKSKILISSNSIQEKNEVIDLFGQQISPQIVDSILQSSKELKGVKKDVCIMFFDIRQFTPFVERHHPEEVVLYLNTLFSFLIEVVQKYNGVINQFLGDGFMATFGAPFDVGNSSQKATEAAQKMIAKIQEEYEKGNIPKTRVGIGLHYADAIIGNIGSNLRKQYSITGRVVILASRIEQLNKIYNTQLLISDNVYRQLKDTTKRTFSQVGYSDIKGSATQILLYKFDENKMKQNEN